MSKNVTIGIVVVLIVIVLVTGGAVLFRHEHTVAIDEAIEPTCDGMGLTEGKHCEDCGEVIVAPQVIPAKGHNIVVDVAVDSTCVTLGKTEGKYCKDCGEVIVAPKLIPVKDHNVVFDVAVDSTCITPGKTEGKHCEYCGEVIVAPQVIPAKGHSIVVDVAVDSTCITPGKTEGKHCEDCGEIMLAQITISMIDHIFDSDYDGFCNVCNYERAVECLHNNLEKIEAIAPTCDKLGYTEGEKCCDCDTVIVEPLPVDKTTCIEGDWILDYIPNTENEGKRHTKCTVCGKKVREESVTWKEILENKRISPLELIQYCLQLIDSENGAGLVFTEDKANAIEILNAIYTFGNEKYNADELDQFLSSEFIPDFGIDPYQIKQMYGLYLWDCFDNDNVTFETMIDYMVEISEYPEIKQFIDEEISSQLGSLAEGIDEFKEIMNKELTSEEFIEFAKNEFGDQTGLSLACNMIFDMASGGSNTATTIELLNAVDNVSGMIPPEFKLKIKNYLYVYDVIAEPCAYTDFIPNLKKVILTLTNEEYEIEVNDEVIQQVYIMYFRDRAKTIPNDKILGSDFVKFVSETITINMAIASQVNYEDILMLEDIITIYDFVSDTSEYDYEEMLEKTHKLSEGVNSMSELMIFTDNDIISVYIDYFIYN